MSFSSRTGSPTDRRVRRTRDALRGALLALLVERGWDDFDVQALCDRANIGRSTFYLHYPNKEALLRGSFADLGDALQARAHPPGDSRSGELAFVRGLIDHVDEQRQVFRALLGRRSGDYVRERFRELLVSLVEQAWREAGLREDWQASATGHYLAGALFELLVWWLGSRRPQQAQDIEALFHRLSAPALQAARSEPG